MLLPLSDCTKLTGISRSGLLKAISRGRVSGTKDPATGHWAIDSAELSRVYPIKQHPETKPAPDNTQSAELDLLAERLRHAEQRLQDLREERDFLRRRVEEETAAIQKLTALLSDQRQQQSAPKETPPPPEKSPAWPWVAIAILSALSMGLAAFLALKA